MRTLTAILTLMTALSGPALAAQLEAASRVVAVEVNPRGATVSRSVTLEVPAGEHDIVFAGLPPSIRTDTVLVRAKATGDVLIGAVDMALVPTPAALDDAARSRLEKRIEALQDQQARLKRRVSDAEFRRAALERLTAGGVRILPQGGGAQALPAQEVVELMRLTGTELAAISDEIEAARVGIRAADEDIARLQLELAQTAPDSTQHMRAAVHVAAAGPVSLTLDLDYMVGEARWRPVYDARLDLGGKDGPASLDLVQRALVWQRTGENWDGVKLTLSTAVVTGQTAAPVLEPVPVGPRPQPAPMAARKLGSSLSQDEASAELAGAAAPQMKEAFSAEATAVDAGFSALYRIPGAATVPSTGEQKSVLIGSRRTTASLRIDMVPMADSSAYVTAVFKPGGDTPLPGGQVSLFRDGVFIGRGGLPELAPGEQAELGFGRDDRVRMTRNVTVDEAGEAGIITARRTMRRGFMTRVENLHEFPVQVRLVERVPYPLHEDITVDVSRLTSEPYEKDLDGKKGVLAWTRTLAAGAAEDIRFGYEVSAPSDMDIFVPQ